MHLLLVPKQPKLLHRARQAKLLRPPRAAKAPRPALYSPEAGHNLRMRLFALSLWLVIAPLPALAEPRLRCELTYAGAMQVVEVGPTDQPYAAPTVDIGGRFHFKAMMVQGPELISRIALYVYVDTATQPLLIQHARYLPPYPLAPEGQAVDLTGEQRLYAGPLERELIYRCLLTRARP